MVQQYFGLFPPLSLAWVAAIAQEHGHKATIIDSRTLGFSIEETIRRIKAYRADAVGFMMTTYMFGESLIWIKAIKKALGLPVIVGGFNLRIYPEESISHEQIDFGVVEQALETLPALLEQMEGQRQFEKVPGLVWKEDGAIRQTPTRPVSFEDFPMPDRHTLPNDLYAEFATERKNFTVMVTSLGCPFHCNFCEAAGYPYNPRSPEKVVDEMEDCRHSNGIREIDIFDYEFTLKRKRTAEICQQIIERNLDITWACRSRVSSVDGPLLEMMAEAGCKRIYYGIETSSDEKLQDLGKDISVKQIQETIQATKDLGIKTLGFFLVGIPGETKKSFRQTVRFAKRLNLDYAQFSKLTAKPGSRLWREKIDKAGSDYWREYILGRVEDRELDRPWTDLTNEEINSLARWAYLQFYTRPGFLLRSLFKVKMWGELKRKTRALFSMMFSQEKKAKADERFKAYQENPKSRLRVYYENVKRK